MSLDIFGEEKSDAQKVADDIYNCQMRYGMELQNQSRFLMTRHVGIDSAMDTLEEESNKPEMPKPEKKSNIKLLVERIVGWLPKIKLTDGKEKA